MKNNILFTISLLLSSIAMAEEDEDIFIIDIPGYSTSSASINAMEKELARLKIKRKNLLAKQTKADSELVYSLSEQPRLFINQNSPEEAPNNTTVNHFLTTSKDDTVNKTETLSILFQKELSKQVEVTENEPLNPPIAKINSEDEAILEFLLSPEKQQPTLSPQPSHKAALALFFSNKKQIQSEKKITQSPLPIKKTPFSFYGKLVNEALKRTRHRVRYDGRYRYIKYPWGDVPKSIGVCTDVVIRSYRKMGIDLQQLVHHDISRNFHLYPSRSRWGLSRPDPNIDHRRVYNLQVFFNRFGQRLPITHRASDYKAGDLVTWQLGPKLPHIGIVVNKPSPYNKHRLMVVHNIGRGPQLEDILFSFPITGHYRYKPNRTFPRDLGPVVYRSYTPPVRTRTVSYSPPPIRKTNFEQQAYSLLKTKPRTKQPARVKQLVPAKPIIKLSQFDKQAQHFLAHKLKQPSKINPEKPKPSNQNQLIDTNAALSLLGTTTHNSPKKLSDMDKAMLMLSQ